MEMAIVAKVAYQFSIVVFVVLFMGAVHERDKQLVSSIAYSWKIKSMLVLIKCLAIQILMSVRMALTTVMRMQSVPTLLEATLARANQATMEMERVAVVCDENNTLSINTVK